MTTLPTDALVRDVIATEIANLLDQRAALKRIPGTHAQQDTLMAQASGLFDEMVELSEQATAPDR